MERIATPQTAHGTNIDPTRRKWQRARVPGVRCLHAAILPSAHAQRTPGPHSPRDHPRRTGQCRRRRPTAPGSATRSRKRSARRRAWSTTGWVALALRVPRAEARRNGRIHVEPTRRYARPARRRAGSQPIATKNSRTHALRAKGDQSPDQWTPPRHAYWCTYSRAWIDVKHVYHLTITAPEKATLTDMLDTCEQ